MPFSLPTVIFLVLVAPVVGSFLGVLIRRIPRGEPFMWGRSHCEACGTTLTARDLVPIVSYLATRGHCRHCRRPIARAHLWVELAAILVPIMTCGAIMATGADRISTAALIGDCILGWALLALAWIDMTCLRLPDAITLPMLLAGIVEGTLADGFDGLTDRTLGAVAGWLMLAGVRYAYRAFRKREGLGGGDVKLLAMGGAWIGLSPLPTVIEASAFLGLAGALCQAVVRGRGTSGARLGMTTRIPFGPCLATAIWLTRLAKCTSPVLPF